MGKGQRNESCLNSEAYKASNFSSSYCSYSCGPEGTVGEVEKSAKEVKEFLSLEIIGYGCSRHFS